MTSTTEQGRGTTEQAAPAPEVRVRAPRYTSPWPMILVESTPANPGEWLSAQLSASDHVGETYWIDLEDQADCYSTYDGARFAVVDHTGRWHDNGAGIADQVTAIGHDVRTRAEAGQPPSVVVVSTVTSSWNYLKRWVDWRAVNSNDARKTLFGVIKPGVRRTKKPEYLVDPDPNATILAGENLWNDAHARHRWLMAQLRAMPAIVILHARTNVTHDGQPFVDTHPDVPHMVHAHVRLAADHAPLLVHARHADHWRRYRPGTGEQPEPDEHLTLEEVIFTTLAFEPPTLDPADLERDTPQ